MSWKILKICDVCSSSNKRRSVSMLNVVLVVPDNILQLPSCYTQHMLVVILVFSKLIKITIKLVQFLLMQIGGIKA